MLTELRITNFAIIDQLELRFPAGLVIFTGETGAGKSIILDAIEALVGARAETTSIREGADRANLEAVFKLNELNRAAITDLLTGEDLLDDPDYVTLGREIRREGRTVARVNGRAVNVGLLRDIGSQLVDIHGQSEHLSLLNVKKHLGLLDRFAETAELLAYYQNSYRTWQGIRRELDHLHRLERDADRRMELLSFQIEEIEAAKPLVDEEQELKEERNRLANAENLAEYGRTALNLLDEANPEMPGISDLVGQVLQALNGLTRIDSSQANLAEQADSLSVLVSELSRDLQTYLDQIEYNPRRLEAVEERLEVLRTLQRKYGGSIAAVLAYAHKGREELEQITHATERIGELTVEEQQIRLMLAEKAQGLSMQRKQSASKLSVAVEKELMDLSMEGARFEVGFGVQPDPQGLELETGETARFDETGIDQVEFLIAPNPGEGLKPMVKIASGGETARLMLALKRVLAQADEVPTLIFDEIDQGIGGRIGFVVGEKLWHLARDHQVLCVTHLPQLAAFGDQHLRVSKQVQNGRTLTLVEALATDGRRNELAQMLGAISESHLTTADETLRTAQTRKEASSSTIKKH
ncbi:MAG TPA: DNA repair protein RecN [Anaerolineales bacterium]|nr:DNA repair protein RecN [Anaerolineales bacterium]